MMYTADYGFIPNTLALDSGPLDVLVLVAKPTFPGIVVEVKLIGVFHMADEKGPLKKLFVFRFQILSGTGSMTLMN